MSVTRLKFLLAASLCCAGLLGTQALAAAPAASAPPAAQEQGNALASADATGGYSGKVLYKISRLWSPPTDTQNRRVSVRLRIDGNGVLQQCDPMTPSDLPEMNRAACAAAKEARDFGTPPYGMPIDVFVTFWTGHPSKNSLGARNPVTAPESPPKAAEKPPVPVTPKVAEKPQEKKAETKKPEEKKVEGKKVEAPAPEAKGEKKVEAKPRLEDKKTPAKTEVKSEPRAEAKTESKPAVKTESQPAVKTEARTEKKAEPAARTTKSESKPEVKAEAKPAPAQSARQAAPPASAAPAPPVRSTAPPAPAGPAVAMKSPSPAVPSGSAGTDGTGTPMSRYMDDIIFMARPRVVIPARVPSGRYQVTVALKVDNRGQVGGMEVAKSSGSEALDQSVLTALGKLGKLSAPPDQKAHTLNLNFSILKP